MAFGNRPITMITLHPEEKIVFVIRKHWFILVPQAVMLLLLVILPTLLPFALHAIPIPINESAAIPATSFVFFIYLLILCLIALIIWIDYYLDTWVITNTRIIDIEQHGLFNREVSEIPLERVQDVTIEVEGIIRTLLHFGTIRVQTAGEREFTIRNIPHLEEVKETILKMQNVKIKM